MEPAGALLAFVHRRQFPEARDAPGLCVRKGFEAIMLNGDPCAHDLGRPPLHQILPDNGHAAAGLQRVLVQFRVDLPFHALPPHRTPIQLLPLSREQGVAGDGPGGIGRSFARLRCVAIVEHMEQTSRPLYFPAAVSFVRSGDTEAKRT